MLPYVPVDNDDRDEENPMREEQEQLDAFLRGEDSLLMGDYYRRVNRYFGRCSRYMDVVCWIVFLLVISAMAAFAVYGMTVSIRSTHDAALGIGSEPHAGAMNCTNTTLVR